MSSDRDILYGSLPVVPPNASKAMYGYQGPAMLSDEAIKTKYEANENTNAYTDADKQKTAEAAPQSDLDAEATARENADTALREGLDTKASISDLTTEIQARIQGDVALQTLINAVAVRSNQPIQGHSFAVVQEDATGEKMVVLGATARNKVFGKGIGTDFPVDTILKHTLSGHSFAVVQTDVSGERVVTSGTSARGKALGAASSQTTTAFPVDTVFFESSKAFPISANMLDASGEKMVLFAVNHTGEMVCNLARNQFPVDLSGLKQPPVIGLLDALLDFPAFVYWAMSYGQSLSRGTKSVPTLSVIQSWFNLMFSTGVRTAQEVLTALVPLVETVSGELGETPVSGMLNGLSKMLHAFGIPSQFLGTADGVGGRSVAQLSKGSLDNIYPNILNSATQGKRLVEAMGKKFALLFWCYAQGEKDYDNGTPRAAWGSTFNQLVADINRDVWEVTGQNFNPGLFINQCTNYASYGKTVPTIALEQWAHCLQNPNAFMTGPGYYFPKASDALHLSNRGSLALGIQYLLALHHVLVHRERFLPLHMKTVLWNLGGGTFSDVILHVPVGELVFDTTIVIEKPFKGFSVRDGNNALQNVLTAAPVIVNANTIRLFHAAGPIPPGHKITLGWGDPAQIPVVQDDGPTILSAPGCNVRDSLVFPYNNLAGGTDYAYNFAILDEKINRGVL